MRALLVVTLGAAVALAVAGCGGSPAKYPVLVYVAGKKVATVSTGHPKTFLPKVLTAPARYGTEIVQVDPAVATRMVDEGLASHKGRVDLPYTVVSTYVPIDPQKALFHHGTEVASLTMVLKLLGIDKGQPVLQAVLPRSGPVDPQPVAGSKLFRWGDPERGFVGRLNGAGTRAFGVYQQPIRRLAARYKTTLVDISGQSVTAVLKDVRDGLPIIAWVGSPGGKDSTWLTPSGKKITVNLSEQTVVLVGTGPGYVLVNNPLTGKQERWTKSEFSNRWALIGQRALEVQ